MGESDLNYRPAGVQQLGEEDANSPFFSPPRLLLLREVWMKSLTRREESKWQAARGL